MSTLDFDYQEDDAQSRRTFGSRFEEEQVYSVDHPAYKLFRDALADELEQIARREYQRRSAADVAILPYTMSAAQVADLSGLYPEFNIVPVPLQSPVHLYWNSQQYMANENLVAMSNSYGLRRVHFGGSQLSALLRADRNMHVHYSQSVPHSLHNHYARMVDTMRIFRDYSHMLTEYRVNVPRKEYETYLATDTYKCCAQSTTCCKPADVALVDLSVFFMSPDQFAASMLQHGAKIGMGFFIYHPTMLVKKEGYIPGTDVYYRKTKRSVEVIYPDGISGISEMSCNDWSLWLTSHMFKLPATDSWYHLELMQNRGPFMFFRMTNVPPPQSRLRFFHALELPHASDDVLVRSWRLKQKFSSDPLDPSSWERHDFVVASRTERRVREFAMQCKPENFSRATIKKQIRVVNDRWVLSGTTVTVMPPLSPDEVENLTTAIYAKTFVDRYESGRLSSALMSKLSAIKGFGDMSTIGKVRSITIACVNFIVRHTLSPIIDGLLTALKVVCELLLMKKSRPKVTLANVPTYLPLKSQVDSYLVWLNSRGEIHSDSGGVHRISNINFVAPGSALLSRMMVMAGRQVVELNGLASTTTVLTDIVDVSEHTDTVDAKRFSDAVVKYNETDFAPSDRFMYQVSAPVCQAPDIVQNFKTVVVDDCVETLNQLYRECLPLVAAINNEYDTYSLSLDPQDRTLSAIYLRCPKYFGDAPKVRSLYRSQLRALNIPKRQNTGQELLTAVATRNLSAPTLVSPQHEDFPSVVWNKFLDNWCVPDAREKLLKYQSDPVALCDESIKNWAGKAKPEVLKRITAELDEIAKPLAEMRVGDYLAMIKADVKPSLSNKPVQNLVAPQVIVYHDKLMSALFSSIFRVLVHRFLSIIKPEILINLRKDVPGMADHVKNFHPFGTKCKYLENDFSQYDKSQAALVFAIEEHVFRQLGMNEEFLQQWEIGHHYSNIRCVSTGLSLHTMYQRKSGDATTAFGNVIINVLSVQYAYMGTKVHWALFMGDDSLVCTTPPISGDGLAVRRLAEQFNLIAKYYITDAPYFASNFVLIDEESMDVKLVPDPVKRIERLSMHISGDEPMWEERWQSCKDTLSAYTDPTTAHRMSVIVPQRYTVPEGFVRGAAAALGTICRDKQKFRELWEAEPQILQA
ncbi:RNA-dependent RNA polymerase [Erysiphe necator associated virga-like virus 6]|nr:RNA-dependent RNA polymerase [Erysiphe necator associated virga-like virus 6]